MAPQEAAGRDRPTLRVGRVNGALRLDGHLDEAFWRAADSIPRLTETEPNEGGVPAGRTVVRVVTDGATIVIGVVADDPEPARITSFSRSRDADLEDEDHVRIILEEGETKASKAKAEKAAKAAAKKAKAPKGEKKAE